jgi:redox-sensitive bicupin YhaK (pirin superfamily)
MITIRKASERGRTHTDWLDSRHTFAFGDYYDARFLGFRSLRVINDDRVAPGAGFGMHPHRDMEILTWVLSGALQHRDSLGSGSVIRPGDLQRMTAGTGIRHSEINPSDTEPVHFLQVWLLPEKTGLAPGYEQRNYPPSERRGRLLHIAGKRGNDGAISIRQDVDVYATLLDKGESVTHQLTPGRHAWLHVATGVLTLNGQELSAGDGAAVSETDKLTLSANEPAEALLFDLA